MGRTVKEIVAERDAKIASIKAEYSTEEVLESTMMGADLRAEMSVRGAELNERVCAVCDEYAAEIKAAEEHERQWVDCCYPNQFDRFF